MTVVTRKDSGSVVAMPSNKGLRCMSYEDTLREMEAFLDGKLDNPRSTQDAYADITEPMSSNVTRVPDNEDPDATENSSSFDDTASRSEHASGTSDVEVESEVRVDGGLASMLDSYNSVFPMRKKKLTCHWRNFIRPLMWRCKWTELRIKELESQALKYMREVEANDQTKSFESQHCTSDFCSKSFPFVNHSVKRKLMRRRKRKHVENVTDISSYMSHHQLFSYLENKKFDPEGTSTGDDVGNLDLYSKVDEFGMDDNWLKDGEDAFEPVLRQIETVQSQVHGLRTQLDMVMLKNGIKFSSSENLSLLAPYDAQTSAAQSPAFSAGNGDTVSIGAIYVPSEHLTDFELGGLCLPDSIVSGYAVGTQIPDIIESTVGLLSAADVSIHQTQIVEFGENNLDDALIQNQGTQDVHLCNGVIDQLTNGYHPENKDQNYSSLPAGIGLVPDPLTGDAMDEDKPTLQSCLTSDIQIPRTKRKRGERKAGPIGWNMRSSGEPEST